MKMMIFKNSFILTRSEGDDEIATGSSLTSPKRRETTEKCIIEGYEIPNKNAWAIGRDPEAWENPKEFYTESERFIPLVPAEGSILECPWELPTLELAFANLLYKFEWEMPSGMKNEDSIRF